jgi:hypothetical protein
MKNKEIIFGEYNKYGYKLFSSRNGQVEEVYCAGNSPYESTAIIPCNSGTLPLKTIRKYCIQTGKEMAKEKGCKWNGLERNDNE